MSQGRNIGPSQSIVVSTQSRSSRGSYPSPNTTVRFAGWLVMVILIFGQFGIPSNAAAGPPIVANEETGGSGVSQPGVGNELTARRLFDEVFSQRALNVCDTLMTSTAINHTPSGTFVGAEGFERFVAKFWKDYPDATFEIDESLASGESLSLRWTMSGHHMGQPVSLQGLAILRFEQNMIAESWIQYDRAALTEQLQAVPAPPEICPPCREP